LKLFIQCFGKDQRCLDGITGQTNSFYSGESEHADHLKDVDNDI